MLSCCCAVWSGLTVERRETTRVSGVGSGVYDVVVPILWTLSCPSTDVTVHGPTAL